MGLMQRVLSNEQVEAFYHDVFVVDQVRDFIALAGDSLADAGAVADVGGGCGYFAQRLASLTGCKVRVIDLDPVSIEACRHAGIEAERGDALSPRPRGDEEIVTFNLVLHHLVGASEAATSDLQRKALAAWHGHARAVFVNEYIYESWLGDISGWLIYQITSSKALSAIGRAVAALIPSLHANTFGVGVRFRSHQEWVRLFRSVGYEVQASRRGAEEPVSLSRRMLLISSIRRDSYILRPAVRVS
jgi:SAM-dependent methyltransferase